jgi:prolipoprotein diacylglyceryltransferase
MLGFVHNLDPVLLRLGPFQRRYYRLVFVATLLVGYLFNLLM